MQVLFSDAAAVGSGVSADDVEFVTMDSVLEREQAVKDLVRACAWVETYALSIDICEPSVLVVDGYVSIGSPMQ